MSSTNRIILVAEDEESDAFVLQLAFQKAAVDCRLVVVPDGQEAVDYLAGNGRYTDRVAYPLPAVVVLDLKMPRMTGFDVLGWLASHSQFSDLPAVVLSSSPDENDIAKARRLGAREYFVKPHLIGELIDIARCLETRWLSGAGVQLMPTDKVG